jgi:hypothetical protein
MERMVFSFEPGGSAIRTDSDSFIIDPSALLMIQMDVAGTRRAMSP